MAAHSSGPEVSEGKATHTQKKKSWWMDYLCWGENSKIRAQLNAKSLRWWFDVGTQCCLWQLSAPFAIRWTNQRGCHVSQPQSSNPAHAPLDKLGPVSADVKNPEDAKLVKLLQALLLEQLFCAGHFPVLLHIVLCLSQGLGFEGTLCWVTNCLTCMLCCLWGKQE